jgi:hypothetical protein
MYQYRQVGKKVGSWLIEEAREEQE